MGWRDLAACAGMDPDLFAPWGVNDVKAEALDACDRCPVQAECAAEAIETGFSGWTIHGGRLPAQWAFKGARLTRCRWCQTRIIVGGRAASDSPYCDNGCRYAHRDDQDRLAHGEQHLFEIVEVPA